MRSQNSEPRTGKLHCYRSSLYTPAHFCFVSSALPSPLMASTARVISLY